MKLIFFFLLLLAEQGGVVVSAFAPARPLSSPSPSPFAKGLAQQTGANEEVEINSDQTTSKKQGEKPNSFLRGWSQFFNQGVESPHPPGKPPPEDLLAPYFLTSDEKKAADLLEDSYSSMEGGMDTDDVRYVVKNGRPVMVSPDLPSIDPALVQAAAKVVGPILKGQMETQVPDKAIKGAVMAGFALTALAGKGAVVSGAAGVGAAYVSITTGPIGQAMRTFGGLTWDVASGLSNAYKQADEDGKVDAFVDKLSRVDLNYWKQFSDRVVTVFPAVMLEREKKKEGVQRSLLAYRLTLEVVEAEKRKEAKIKEERLQEEARIAEEARRMEETRAAEEKSLVTDSKSAEDSEEEDFILDDDASDWEASIMAAQQSIDGKIAGLEDSVMEEDETSDWISAGDVAGDLVEEEEEELDAEELARLARQAVDAFEQEFQAAEGEKQKQRRAWDEDMFEFDDDDDLDLSSEDDLETLAAAARAAVEMSDSGFDVEESSEEDGEPSLAELAEAARLAVEQMESSQTESTTMQNTLGKDWSKLTVAKLRNELRDRGLPTSGKKAELIALLEESDLDLQKDREDDVDVDVEETISLESFEKDFEEGTGFFDVDSDSDIDKPVDLRDWSTFTVAELRQELKTRGMPSTGKKMDLITRLEEDDYATLLGEVPFDEDSSTSDNFEEFEYDESGEDEFTEEEEEDSKDFTAMTVAELKDELRQRGLRVSGKKQELVDRLISATASM